MTNGTNGKACGVAIRTPRENEIGAIIAVVRGCEPFLTAHMSYIYWMNVHNYRQTCAVAEMGGELVGWCSIFPVSGGRYFLYQLGVAPHARRHGVGELLITHLLAKLKGEYGLRELEFTVDRKNRAALNLIRSVAHAAELRLLKRPGFVELLEVGCEEELYVVTPATAQGPEYSNGSDESEVHQ